MSDLVVVSRQLEESPVPDMRAVASQVVTGSDRTVVAVPENARGFDAAGVAMIAWDGSEEAMKAVQAAMPLLQLARAVTIVEVGGGAIETPAEEAAAYLSRHDVKAVVIRRRDLDTPPG